MGEEKILVSTGGIRVKGSAVGSALITGNDNIVTIVYGAEFLRAQHPFGDNPYRGLNAFDRASCDFFFGRERLVAALVDRLVRLTSPISAAGATRLLAIMGPSGCGKSSVARAGLIPALAQSRAALAERTTRCHLAAWFCPDRSASRRIGTAHNRT